MMDSTAAPPATLLEVQGLRKFFGAKTQGAKGAVRAVDGVDFDVRSGETLGIVGESGSGKSTVARLLVRLLEPDAGTVSLDGRILGACDGPGLADLRRRMQMVFQDSFASLNPRLTIGESIAFGPWVQGRSKQDAAQIAADILEKVGLPSRLYADRYPHELSGGQRQRVNIARALALDPQIVILDEAVSALDKSIEAQVLNLLIELKARLGLTYLFISHDLHIVQYVSDRVMVMYLGRIVEVGPVAEIYQSPRHPYTQALLSAMPSMDPDRRTTEPPLTGDPPNPINPPSGCRFRTRCRFAEAICAQEEPVLCGSRSGCLTACHMTVPGSGHSKAGSV